MNIALGVAGPAGHSCEVVIIGYEIWLFEVGVLNEVRAEGVYAGVNKLTLKQLKDCKHEHAFHLYRIEIIFKLP